jgi:peptidoglycan hydrolase-like protein with peptidoglycan-binding domain
MINLKTAVLFVSVVLTIITGYWLISNQDSILSRDTGDGDTSIVSTAVLEIRDLKTYKELDGILKYGDSFFVSPSNDGVLTYVAFEGSELSRGNVIYRFYRSISDTDYLALDQQIASAEASVAQSQLALENLTKDPDPAQIASANAAVAQAELTLKNLTKDPEPYQVSSSNASVAQAQFALDNTLSAPSDMEFASAELSVQQSKSNLISAKGSKDTQWISFRISRRAYCDAANDLDIGQWLENYGICPDDKNQSLTDQAADELIERMFVEEDLITLGSNLLSSHVNYTSASTSYESAVLSMESAEFNLESLKDPASSEEMTQSSENLKSVEEQRISLQADPELLAIEQATESLKSAVEQRNNIYDGPNDKELIHAEYSLTSAKLSLDIALSNRNELVGGPHASVLMYGDIPAWREFQIGMSSGLDIKQLKQNLIALGLAAERGLKIDTNYDADTAEIVKEWQLELGLVQTGRLSFGDVIFLPGVSLVEYSTSFPSLGAHISTGTPLMSLVPIADVQELLGADGKIQYSDISLQRVQTSIQVADKDLISIGSLVKIELPDESNISGKVVGIGRTAVIPSGNQDTDPYLEVSVKLDDDIGLPEWTGADVTVFVTKELASNVLAAPVTSLLALLDGGYALEVYRDGIIELVPIELGIYSDGWVEVYGPGLNSVTEVVVPE